MSKVSVVMPIYNVEQYVAQAIESVLAQRYRDFELLIIDDCSPDRSVDICEQFQDPRIRIIRHQENRGLAGARNTGIRNAVGEYIAFLDSDDAWHPDKLALHVAHLDSSADIGISFSRSAFMDADGQLTGYYQMPKLTDIDPGHCFCRNPVGNGSAPVLRRETLAAIASMDNRYSELEQRYFDEDLRQSEDIECWIRILLQTTWRMEGIPHALTYYRLNAGGLSAQLFKQLASWDAVVEKTRSYAADFIARWQRPARAYQLRYLGRQAIRLQDGAAAVHLVNRALFSDWSILKREPGRTLCTLGAAYSLRWLPKPLYKMIEDKAQAVVAGIQRRRIGRDLTARLMHISTCTRLGETSL